MAVTLTLLYHTGKLSLDRLVELRSVNPRKILGLPAVTIKEGEQAELCIFDPELEWVVEPQKLHSKSKNSVFKGEKLRGRNVYTVCRGEIVFEL